jgi:hypothetical protein
MSNAGKGSVQLYRLLEATFIKHRKSINLLGYSDKIANAYIQIGLASEILIAAMNDPSIKVPALDKEIPRMKLDDNHDSTEQLKISH